MCGAHSLARHIKPLYPSAPFLTGKQCGKRNLYFYLGRKHTAVDNVRIQLSFRIIIGVAGIQSIRIDAKIHQILQIYRVYSLHMPALPHADITAVITGLFPSAPSQQYKTCHIRRIRRNDHGRKIVPVTVHIRILRQGSPIGDTIPFRTVYSVRPCGYRQIPVACGIDHSPAVISVQTVRPGCRSPAATPAFCSPLTKGSENHAAKPKLNTSLQTQSG